MGMTDCRCIKCTSQIRSRINLKYWKISINRKIQFYIINNLKMSLQTWPSKKKISCFLWSDRKSRYAGFCERIEILEILETLDHTRILETLFEDWAFSHQKNLWPAQHHIHVHLRSRRRQTVGMLSQKVNSPKSSIYLLRQALMQDPHSLTTNKMRRLSLILLRSSRDFKQRF